MLLRTVYNVGSRLRIPSRGISSLLTSDSSKINLELLKNKLANSSNSVDDLAKLYRKIDNSDIELKEQLLDELINTADSFSIYFKLNDLKLPNQGLAKLIESNPGRVYSAWDLYKNNSRNEVDSTVLLKVAEKILVGEMCDEGEYKIDSDGLSRLFELLEQVNGVPQGFANLMISKFAEGSILGLIKDYGLSSNQLLSYLTSERNDIDDYTCLRICQIIFEDDPSLLSLENLSFCINLAKRTSRDALDSSYQTEAKNCDDIGRTNTAKNGTYTSGYSEFLEKLIHHLESVSIDLSDIPESLLVRISLMEYYGFEQNDIDLCLRKFHQYQTHQKFGLEIVQSKLVPIFTYQAVKQNNQTHIKIAQTLLTEQIPMSSLQSLIVALSFFNLDDALKLYNDYIPHVAKKLNPNTNRSPTGLLTEALVLGYLANNDREFAQLVLQKAIDNEVVQSELEIATIKKIMKLHGDAWADEDKEKATAYLKEQSLSYIKSL